MSDTAGGAVTIQRSDLEALLARASEKGATRALERLGLQDEDAASDVRELRNLLEAWRDAKREAWRTAIRSLTTAVLVLLAAGTAIKFWPK